MEETNAPIINQEIDQNSSKSKIKVSREKLKIKIIEYKKIILIGLIVVVLLILTSSSILVKNSSKSLEDTTTPTPSIEPSPTNIPSPTVYNRKINSPTPSVNSQNGFTPTPTTSGSNNNSLATPPTPTTSNAKPEFSITYPSDGQTITFDDPNQQFCVVTIPIANTSGTDIYININGGGWQSWHCFVPSTGSNTIQVKHSGSNKESDIQSRTFIFVKNY